MYKTVLIHDWLGTMAGAEKVLESIYELYPSDIYTIIANYETIKHSPFKDANIKTSFIQDLPFAIGHYRKYLPLMPIAVEQFDLSEYDLVISSSHAVAKGAITSPNQLHISYIHSPIRYAWDMQHTYLRESGLERGLKGWLARWILHKMRIWDQRTSNGVDYFIANSHYIARRIWKVYRRDSVVIYPPVDVNSFSSTGKKDRFFLAASRMVPYKKMGLIVEAFSLMPELRLVVIGDGPDYRKVAARAGRNIELIGWQSQESVRHYLERARAFIFAAEEDFGILPVEAQACGCPVIAYGRGGVRETVIEGETGMFFYEQTVEDIISSVKYFLSKEESFDSAFIRSNAARFSKERFQQELSAFVNRRSEEFFSRAVL